MESVRLSYFPVIGEVTGLSLWPSAQSAYSAARNFLDWTSQGLCRIQGMCHHVTVGLPEWYLLSRVSGKLLLALLCGHSA